MDSHHPDIPLVQPSRLRLAHVMPVVPWCHVMCRAYAWAYMDQLAGQHSLPLPQKLTRARERNVLNKTSFKIQLTLLSGGYDEL